MRFKIGDLVRIREDLIAGLVYIIDSKESPKEEENYLTFPSSSVRYMGKYGVVVEIINGTYILSLSEKARFSEGMLYNDNYSDDYIDTNYLGEYQNNTEELLNHLLKKSYKSMIDKSLDNNDEDSFEYYSQLLTKED